MIVDCSCPRANHQHGTYLGFKVDGCRCAFCVRAHRIETKRTRYRTAAGTHSYTDARAARHHVRYLLAHGLTVSQIEHRSGVNRTSIRVLIGDFPNRPQSKRITRKTETALLAVTATRVGPETSGLVDPTGTRRRLQALVALGHQRKNIAGRLGWSSRTFYEIVRNDRPVLAATRAAVIDLYDELSMTLPAPGPGATRARNSAAAQGWLPPLAWDDDLIDDPSYQPTLSGGPDRRDLLEDYQWLIDAGESHDAACRTLGVTTSAIDQARKRAQARHDDRSAA